MLCDEGHRLKGQQENKTTRALDAAPCKRRVIITCTPVQNDLHEFHSLVNFVNPDALSTPAAFRRVYAIPIEISREAGAKPADVHNIRLYFLHQIKAFPEL